MDVRGVATLTARYAIVLDDKPGVLLVISIVNHHLGVGQFTLVLFLLMYPRFAFVQLADGGNAVVGGLCPDEGARLKVY
jgi:hypothetical protein